MRQQSRHLVTLIVGMFLLLSIACSAPDAVVGPASPDRVRKSEGGECEPTRPQMNRPDEMNSFGPNDCPSDPFIGVTEAPVLSYAALMGAASPEPRTEFIWRGENLSATEPRCPTIIKRHLALNWDGMWYTFPAPLRLVEYHPPGGRFPGWAYGVYEGIDPYTTNMPVVSDDFRSQISGIDGRKPRAVVACHGDFVFNFLRHKVWVGFYASVGMIGRITPYGSYNSSYYEPKGWTYGEYTYSPTGDIIGVRVQNGVGDGWQGALDDYIADGSCSIGWEIWVDGEQVCNADGSRVGMT